MKPYNTREQALSAAETFRAEHGLVKWAVELWNTGSWFWMLVSPSRRMYFLPSNLKRLPVQLRGSAYPWTLEIVGRRPRAMLRRARKEARAVLAIFQRQFRELENDIKESVQV